MNEVEDYIKLFGMTNLLVTNELDGIERQYEIDLGHKACEVRDSDEVYYPQFEMAIRTEATMMARHYELFYCLENAVRALIGETMKDGVGPSWWDSGKVPRTVTDEVARRIKRETDSGITRRSMEPIDYTTFGELGEIIKANWDLFGSVLNSPKAVELVLARLNTLRAPIAHCSPLAEDEVLRLRLSVRDWFRLME